MTVLHQPVKAFVSIGALWHQRLGHPSNQNVKMLGLPSSPDPCEICLTGKSSFLPFSGIFDKAQHPLDCVHLDVVGPINPSSNTRLKYFLTIVDQFTSFKSNLPQSFWAEAVNTATFLPNLIPTVHRDNKSPFVLWAEKIPLLKRLRTFCCKAFILIQQKYRGWKLAPTSEEGILLGFENDNSSYRILWLRDKKVVVTRHVLFIEDNFPFLDESNHTDCSRWVDINDKANLFFDSNESAVDESHYSNSEVHGTIAQESP
ncbi:hypothetical protein O181_003040 [Austropuccinia psidii MF-1]|uniref:GAG-pre-integrase domain-containing protein n=1 Tax=Austropuccinia psidii MF-1 TaxID=1389203 RepID=A0A9Q3BDM1_9BASI|nr:hypothetical protein [Austropuccinia psidii MF-1]